MLFQEIKQPQAILRTDFDEFLVMLKELETDSFRNENPFGTVEEYNRVENFITATIKIHEQDSDILYSLFAESNYTCEPKYMFSLETEAHTFGNGIIMELNREDELELKIRFKSFVQNETYEECSVCQG